MLTWMFVNAGLSLLALLFIALNASAPHRLRFFAGFAALAAWLVPWTLLPKLPLSFDLSWGLSRMERSVDIFSAGWTGITPIVVQTSAVPLARDFMIFNVLELVFIAFTVTGLALFLWNLASHHYRLRRLAGESSDGDWLWGRAGLAAECPVLVQHEIAGAFSSGLWHPRIWVHGDLVASAQLPTLLRHELTHIRQHDNWYLILITLVEKLFWWNPLVWYLGRDTRELQELSCDESCQRSISDYPAQLAQLMLDSAPAGKPRMLALSANILNKPNPNVKRIELLQRSYVMKARHIVSAVVTVVAALSGIGLVTAQPEPDRETAQPQVQALRMRTSMAVIGDSNQFVKIQMPDGEARISFAFSDAPLPIVLIPLAGFVSGTGPGARPAAVVTLLDEFDEHAVTSPRVSTMRVVEEVGPGGVIASSTQGNTASFTAATPVPPAGPFNAPVFGARPLNVMGVGLNDNLVLEYPAAADKIVTVTGTDLTLDEAIDLIAEESGCNIFEEEGKIVVDYCD